MKLLTITLNPVYDIFYTIPHFQPYRENLANKVEVFTGGKAINVSRALRVNGYDNTAVLLLGKENSQAFENGIRADGIDARFYYTEGRIRENLTTLTDGIPETRICVNTFSVKEETLDTILTDLQSLIDRDTIVVCSGKFPQGLTMTTCMAFLRKLMAITPYVALDSQTFGAAEILALQPWMIKPNAEELEALIGYSCTDTETIEKAAEALHRGGIAHVLVSLGGDGAIYCGALGQFRIEVPSLTPQSTIGAGDSTLAGFVSAFAEGLDGTACVTRACAFGSAACLEPGTNPPRPETIATITPTIRVIAKNKVPSVPPMSGLDNQ